MAAERVGLPPPGLWVYSDFTADGIPGGDRSSEYHFGLYRSDGTAKPVAASVQAANLRGDISCGFNNGFEEGIDGGLPADWQIQGADSATFSRDREHAHGGAASARIANSANSASPQPSFFLAPPYRVVAGATYRLTAWASAAGAAGTNRISLAWVDDNERWLRTDSSQPLGVGTVGWTQLHVNAVAPAGAAYAEIHLESKGNPGSVWFDDVSFGPLAGDGTAGTCRAR